MISPLLTVAIELLRVRFVSKKREQPAVSTSTFIKAQHNVERQEEGMVISQPLSRIAVH